VRWDDARPFVLVASGARGQRVAAANRAARAAGVTLDMTHADACAVVQGLLSRPTEPKADVVALRALARFAERYTPIANTDGEDGLVLDVTGCSAPFGGEAGLLQDLTRRLAHAELTAKPALADSWGAAWALTRYGEVVLVPPGEQRTALASLPVAGLRLTAETVTLLRRLGLTRIGDLYRFPRSSLARRFRAESGLDNVLLRLDQALGRVPEPIVPLRPEPLYREYLAPLDPILDQEGLAAGLRLLLVRILRRLERDVCAIRRLTLEATRGDGKCFLLEVRTSRPARDLRHLMRLFAERLPAIDPGFGIDLLVLETPETVRVEASQPGFAGREQGTAEKLAPLVDRLTVRLGERSVWQLAPFESHVPERAQRRHSAAAEPAAWSTPGDGPGRPLRLLRRPEPISVTAEVPDGPPIQFTWRKAQHRVARATGPERIAPEWWLTLEGPSEPPRDYYEVEDEAGRRYWLFRCGLYDGKEETLPWFMHGLFS
jgi:protein ImuB